MPVSPSRNDHIARQRKPPWHKHPGVVFLEFVVVPGETQELIYGNFAYAALLDQRRENKFAIAEQRFQRRLDKSELIPGIARVPIQRTYPPPFLLEHLESRLEIQRQLFFLHQYAGVQSALLGKAHRCFPASGG